MGKVIYFIGRDEKGTRHNPYFSYYNPIVAVANSMEKAVEFCEKYIDYLRGNYERSGMFNKIETNTPFKLSCKYDYNSVLTFDIRKRVLSEKEYEKWMENKKSYYRILK